MSESEQTARTNVPFIRVSPNQIINQNCVTWIRMVDECFYVCVKKGGCSQNLEDTHKICNFDNPSGYNKLNELFSSSNN